MKTEEIRETIQNLCYSTGLTTEMSEKLAEQIIDQCELSNNAEEVDKKECTRCYGTKMSVYCSKCGE